MSARTRKPQKFFAVRVIVRVEDGSTKQRDYVRGAQKIGRHKFICQAIGDMLTLTGAGEVWGYNGRTRMASSAITWEVKELRRSDVYDDDFILVCEVCEQVSCDH